MPGQKLIVQRAVLLAGSLLVSFLLAEISTRVYLASFAKEETFEKYASLQQLEKRLGTARRSPHVYLPHYPTPNYRRGLNKHNSLGYRGEEIVLPKPDGEFRIVALGGSTTYTTGVEDYRLSYPALLEKELAERGHDHVRVINAGEGGWGSWESLINFQFRVLDLDPDMIIVYHAVNDIHRRLVWPPEAYRGDNSGRRKPREWYLIPGLLEHSAVFRVLMINAGRIMPYNDILNRFPDTYYGRLFRTQVSEGVYPEGIFEDVSASQMLTANKPIYFKRNIENLVAIAKFREIEVMLATFAYSPLFDDPRASSKEYVSAYAEANEAVKTIAQEMGVHLFDFASQFPTDREYYQDGRHVNERGSRLKAKLFADFIDGNGLIPVAR